MAKNKLSKQYPNNLRGMSGFFFIPFAPVFMTVSMSMLMTYFTDFSGIDAAMGKAGYAAAFGTLFLLVTRIVDAVDDPIQGWVLDSTRECKFGKYRRFAIIGTVILCVGGIMLFAMPTSVKASPVLLWIWAVFAYLLFDMGAAMSGVATPLLQKATTNAQIRTKIAVILRLSSVFGALPAMFYVTIVTALGKDGDLSKTASTVAIVLISSCCILSWIGAAIIKEPYSQNVGGEKKASPINFKEIGYLLKVKPMWVHFIGFFIGNMAYTLASAVMLYFIRWYFCADLATGEVDLARFTALSGIYSLITLLPNFLSPFLTPILLRIFKTIDRSMYSCMLMMSVGYVLIYIFNVTGIMKSNPYLLFALFFLIMMPSGATAQFAVLLTIESADYAEYTIGRSMTALTNSIYGLTQKAASALGAVIPGALLIAVGYSVDAATGSYAGELSSLPSMVNGLSLILSLVPAIVATVAFLIYRFLYKITPEMRAQMTRELDRRHTGQADKTQTA